MKEANVFISMVILSSIFILLTPSLVSANRGMIVVGPREVDLQESGQNAIVAWNGEEEVIILSTDAKSSESTLVLEVLPLPSNPTKVEGGSFDSFTKLTWIINRKVRAIREQEMIAAFGRGVGSPGVEITIHKKIGAHDVTVVKVNDLDYFINWVKDFTARQGFEYAEISPEFENTVANYLNRDIKFFVFDVIETGKDRQSIKPLIYRFKTDFLYYPLEITATSDAGGSSSEVNIFLIAKGTIDETTVGNVYLWPRTGFDYDIELSENELKEVSPEIADLFSSAYVMNAYYYGPLNSLNKDLVVYQQGIHVPTFFDKISQRVSRSISASLLFTFVSGVWAVTFHPYAPIWGRVLSAIVLFSFIVGIPSIVFIIAKSIEKLLKKYNLGPFSRILITYVLSMIIILSLLLSTVVELVISGLVIFTIIGFSMMVSLMIKFFKKHVF